MGLGGCKNFNVFTIVKQGISFELVLLSCFCMAMYKDMAKFWGAKHFYFKGKSLKWLSSNK
jgi:hypothetical protein